MSERAIIKLTVYLRYSLVKRPHCQYDKVNDPGDAYAEIEVDLEPSYA
jgi:hypothetical protein